MQQIKTSRFAQNAGLIALSCLFMAGVSWAQASPNTVQPAGVATTDLEPRWNSLTPTDRQALEPLQSIWPTLSQGHKRKWLALAKNYPTMPDLDREKLHSRMVEWAALTAKEREQARVNFAKTKKLPADASVATWEAYQALPDEEKRALLESAPKKPAGAAIAPKPAPASKLAEVPVTRKSPEVVKAATSARPTIDRYTLLPQKENTSSN